ncbi:MAG: hypothetical protein HQK83_02610, partial [Fibrobacteria bacterium]|nr:hypothetical protein [Fibrobacteria bacterium]
MMRLRQYTIQGTTDYPLTLPLVLIGSAEDADIQLKDKTLPPVAAKLIKEEKGYRLENPDKLKKILLNGKQIKAAQLMPGDRLEIASFIFIFELTEKPSERITNTTPVASEATVFLTESASEFYQSLTRFAQAAGEEKDLNKVLENILHILMELTGGTEAIIFTLSPKGEPEAVIASGVKDAKSKFSDTVIQG